MSTFRFSLINGVSVVIDAHVHSYLNGKDQEVMQRVCCGGDLSRNLKELSPELKDCLLAIGGAGSADLLGVDPSSCSKPFLDLKHFPQKPIEFFLRHISQLPPWTRGQTRGKGSGDRIVVERFLSPPYLQGDFRAKDPKSAMDFAMSADLRDSVWVSKVLAFVSQVYAWHKLYLAEPGAAAVYRQVLSGTRLFNMGDDTRTYGDADIKYKPSASAPFRVLKEISEQHRNKSIAIGGPNHTILRPGMGVVIDPAVSQRVGCGDFDFLYGSIIEVDADSGTLTIRLHLCRETMPGYALIGLGGTDLVQTNAALRVPMDWVTGSFRILPPLLFSADCIPQECEAQMKSTYLSRVVVADMQFLPPDGEHSFIYEDDDEFMTTFEMFTRLVEGHVPLTLRRMKPFPAELALNYLSCLHQLHGDLIRHPLAYRSLLGNSLTTFARNKTQHAKAGGKDQFSFRPDLPGNVLLELVHSTVDPAELVVVIRPGILTVEVKNVDALQPVFGRNPSSFDFRDEGLGVLEFHGPFVFKWNMYDSLDPWGSPSGSVSVSVGSYTEYNRMGTDVIKSSKRHPEALRGSGIKAPAEKKARTAKASTADTGRAKQASNLKATAQMEDRKKRYVSRSNLSADGSGTESTSTLAVRHSSSRSQSYSDSQSGGDGPAAASWSDSQSGGGNDGDWLLEAADRRDEELPNVEAVKPQQGELRGGGSPTPA